MSTTIIWCLKWKQGKMKRKKNNQVKDANKIKNNSLMIYCRQQMLQIKSNNKKKDNKNKTVFLL